MGFAVTYFRCFVSYRFHCAGSDAHSVWCTAIIRVPRGLSLSQIRTFPLRSQADVFRKSALRRSSIDRYAWLVAVTPVATSRPDFSAVCATPSPTSWTRGAACVVAARRARPRGQERQRAARYIKANAQAVKYADCNARPLEEASRKQVTDMPCDAREETGHLSHHEQSTHNRLVFAGLRVPLHMISSG